MTKNGAAPVRVAFGDVSDPRVRDAVSTLAADAVLEPVLVGHGADLQGWDARLLGQAVEVPDGDDPLAALAAVLSDVRADAAVAGSLSNSPDVIRAGIRGLARQGLVVGAFVMQKGTRVATFADCSVTPEPTVHQLVEIAVAAAELHRATTGEQPRVGMLSFSTDGSADHPNVTKVRGATVILRSQHPELYVDGEMQFDTAVDPLVGSRKLPGSPVAGRANVLVFPTLDAGNIAYKVAERVGGARALGSFVLNLSHPWVDLSRGCSTDDLIDTARLVARAATTRHLTKEQIA